MTTAMTRYYLLSSQYVGPSRQPTPRDVLILQTVPGRTNISREVRTEGWLGTTNDWWEHAHGEYETREAAEAAVRARWQTYELPEDALEWLEGRVVDEHGDSALVAAWGLGDHDPQDEWDVHDWLASASTLEECGVTADSTDEELSAIAERLAAEARSAGVWIMGGVDAVRHLLTYRRDVARAGA